MKASFYESDITPPLGGYMWGYYVKRISQDVFEKLYAKSIVLEDNGNYAVIIDVDVCTLTPEMHGIVTKRIYEYTGICPECVCISANHTHRGATIHDSHEIHCFADEPYKDVFYRLVADSAILAYKRLGDESVTVKYGKTKVEDLAYNRTAVLEDGTYVTHPIIRTGVDHIFGTTDTDFTMLYFEKDGKPIGSITNFAMHQDSAGVSGYTGDYASVLSEHLKDKFGRDFVSVFMLGACGDINDDNPDPNKNIPQRCRHRHIGKKLFEYVESMMDNLEEIDGGVSSIKESITIKRRTSDSESLVKEIDEHLKKYKDPTLTYNLLTYRMTNQDTDTEVYVQVIKIGDVIVCALPGENFVQTGLNLKAASPYDKTIIATNCNTYTGYIPTLEAFAPQSSLYEISTNFHSNLIPEAAEILTNKGLELISKV